MSITKDSAVTIEGYIIRGVIRFDSRFDSRDNKIDNSVYFHTNDYTASNFPRGYVLDDLDVDLVFKNDLRIYLHTMDEIIADLTEIRDQMVALQIVEKLTES